MNVSSFVFSDRAQAERHVLLSGIVLVGRFFSLVHPLTEGEPLEGSAFVQWSPPPWTQSLTSSHSLSNQGGVKHTCEFSNLFSVASSVASSP